MPNIAKKHINVAGKNITSNKKKTTVIDTNCTEAEIMAVKKKTGTNRVAATEPTEPNYVAIETCCTSSDHALESLHGKENKEYWGEGQLLNGLACAKCKLKFALRPQEKKEEINPRKVYFCKKITPLNDGKCTYSLCGNCFNDMLLANRSLGKRKRKRTPKSKGD